jgi:hypothetical protein
VIILVDCAILLQSLVIISECTCPVSFSLALLYPQNNAGLNSSLAELTDFISAAQMSKVADAHLPLEVKVINFFS